MKKFMKKNKKSINHVEYDKLKQQLTLIEKHEAGLRELSKSMIQTSEAANAAAEQGKALADNMKNYGVQLSSDNVALAGCLRTIGDFQKNVEELRAKMNANISERFQTPLKAFEEDIDEAKNAKKAFDKAQASYDSAVTREKNKKPGRVEEKEKEKAKVTKAKEHYEDSGEKAFAKLVNTNERLQLTVLEKMCDYMEDYYNFLQKAQSMAADLRPEMIRYREQAKKLKDRLDEEKMKGEFEEKTFGVPIVDLLRFEGGEVPLLMQECISYIEEKAMDVEGLFRIPGDKKEIEQLRQSWDRGNRVEMATIQNPHTVTGLLKLFLRQLPEPLLTSESYHAYSVISQKICEEDPQISALTEVLSQLPTPHLKSVDALFAFCVRLATHSESNKMGVKNLSTLIAPNILYPKHSTNILDELSHSARVVEVMIAKYDQIFPKLMEERQKRDAQRKQKRASAPTPHTNNNISNTSDSDQEYPLCDEDGLPLLLTGGDKQKRITRRMAAKATRAIIHRASLLTSLALANEAALNEAFDDVLDRRASSGWLIVGYQSNNTLEFQKSGRGGVEELVQQLHDDQVQYAVIRVPSSKSAQATKDVFIAWSGPGVKSVEVSKKKSHLGEVKELLKPFHCELFAVGKTNFNLETVLDRSGPLSGSHIID